MELKAFLNSSYESIKFETFISENFHGFSVRDSNYTDDYLSESEKCHIQDYRYLGQVELDDGKEVGFFEFRSTSSHIENKRVGYNATLKKLAEDHVLDGALASFFYPDGKDEDVWRLSFVGIDYDRGKTNVTNLKRYTYVLGKDVPIQTPLEQLKDLKYPTIQKIEKAFSVEKVSKEFFEKYKKLYVELSNYLQSQMAYFGNEKNLNLFTKKLLGRVVFLYFIQKKGWFGSKEEWGTGNKKFLSDLFEDCEKYDNFYSDILRPIFFKALNEKRDNDYFELLDCKMPFLNGGLFSKDEFDEKEIIIDNTIFVSIFTTFNQYNFTIIEDNPNDSEVAIDPEMLGRVFESLLEDRKEKGAFYTPREIVHYMSRNAIEHYLKNEAKDYNYVFSVDEFLHKTSLEDDEILKFHTEHPVKFIKLDNYFEELHPYKNLVVDFYIVAKLRGLWLDAKGNRTKNAKGRTEITHEVWQKILQKEYEVIAINFGSNKEIKLDKTYKYPTILKYIQIEEHYFSLAFLPNIWGDLELTTIFPIRYKEIKRKLKKFDKPLHEINEHNFVFDSEVYKRVEELREDCRPLHTEPLHQGAELPRQAVIRVKQGLSTFRNSFTPLSLADSSLKRLLKNKDYYQKTINKLLNSSTLTQHKLKDIMLKKLKEIKVLDPAIGSGAFPMGVLHELVDLRRHLGDKTDLVKLKKEIIENSIYGIDIEPSAVEIAKLRFWLSIVVDEETPSPLPNLFYKIMVGNSLLETINGFDPLAKQDAHLFGDSYQIDTLQDKFHEYFKAWDNDKKKVINSKINEIIDEVLDSKLRTYEEELESQLRNRDLFKLNTKNIEVNIDNIGLIKKVKKRPTTELFFYKLYFAEVMNDGGFNVIIGNPPYVRQEKIKELKPKLKIENYQSYNGTADLYIYFFEKGFKLLKENGILSYITSNKYTRAKYGKEFRKFILENTNILEYVDFNGVKVFESATVDTSIFTYKKSQLENSSFIYCDIDSSYKKSSELEKFIAKKGFEYLQSDLNIDSFSFANPKELVIKKQIEKIGTPLKEWNIKISYGIKTGLNEAFIIDSKIKDILIKKDQKSSEIIKPLLRGRDIHKNSYDYEDKWIILTKYNSHKYLEKDYPSIFEFLLNYKDKLLKRGQCTNKGGLGQHHWLELDNNPNDEYLNNFELDKIIYPEFSSSSSFYYDTNKFYLVDTAWVILGGHKYMSALLNSKLVWFYLSNIVAQLGSKAFRMKKTYLNLLPIPKIQKEEQKPFEILVDYILFAKDKKLENEAQLFEAVIDNMVYDLYFEEKMKEVQCYITDVVTEIAQPFSSDDSDALKEEFVKTLYEIFKEDKIIQRGLIYSRNIEEIAVINGVNNG